MRIFLRTFLVLGFLGLLTGNLFAEPAQTLGGGVIEGTITDPSGAVVPNAKVTIKNPVTNFEATATTDATGVFRFRNVPYNPYHLTVVMPGFASFGTDAEIRSTVPVNISIKLQLAETATQVTVEASSDALIENNPVAHTDVDQSLIARLPSHSVSSPLSSAITLTTPGVTADSNGMFHPLGEHADTSFALDNQPITDQQSKVFSNQIPTDSIQSMEVISGVPPAEFGDKNSLVVRVTTKSGLGADRTSGSIATSYGSFGTASTTVGLTTGSAKWGNYVSATGLNSGRFLDTPEFFTLHAHGNSQTLFDRFDWNPSAKDQIHLNLGLARSWFQIPNGFDQEQAGQDQRQLMNTFNVAPSWTHLFNSSTLLTSTIYVRQDRVHYYPSNNPFDDLPATLAQNRRLTNAGLKLDLSYVKGRHNIKTGFLFAHTFLSEFFNLGITNSEYNAVCVDPSGSPVAAPGITNPSACAGAGFDANPGFLPGLLPFDLTRNGTPFVFRGSADIKQEALYAQDSITAGNFNFNLGARVDNYDGLSHGTSIQPRLGVAYNIKKTNTVLRGSYGRLFETPYNENLVLSSSTGLGGLATSGTGSFGEFPLPPGARNQFNVGFQQGFGRWAVVDAEYFWKFTHNAYDFDTLFNTPLTFPIAWRKSKIDGLSVRVTMPTYKGISAYTVMGHTRARFFSPEIGGLLFNSPLSTGAFRIDHDQAFSQTTNMQYQPGKRGPWVGFTWRYDSGQVAGAVPDLASLLALTPAEQATVGFFCGSQVATFTQGISSCGVPFPQWGAKLVRVPAPGTENDDSNPPRIAPRNLFDASIGIDNVLTRGDRYRLGLRFTAINLTNKVALYNFLSTFSGTHFVPPRSYTGEVVFHF